MVKVNIHSGPHYTDSIIVSYLALGSFDQVEEGARVKCGQMLETRGHRVRVEFMDSDGATLTSRIFQED